MSSYHFTKGERVELHPACDMWMRGARYGTVVAMLPHSGMTGADGGLVQDAGDGVPKGFRGEVLSITDHGNVSLYAVSSRGKWREIWSVA